MPETVKEVAKVAAEVAQTQAGGALAEWWRWVIGGVGTGLFALWGHITGRVKHLEDTVSTQQMLREHTETEEKKFDALFALARDNAEVLTRVRESVARIEGILDNVKPR